MQEDIIDYAWNLYDNGFIYGPEKCSCGSKMFKIYKDIKYKI